MKKKPYSRIEDFKSRLILCAILVAIFGIASLFVGCSEEDAEPIQLTGTWTFDINVQGNELSGQFTIKKTGADQYAAENVVVNNSTWEGYDVEMINSNTVERITLINNEGATSAEDVEIIAFLGISLASSRANSLTVDSVAYRNLPEIEYQKVYNQILKKN